MSPQCSSPPAAFTFTKSTNARNLGADALDVVNLRAMADVRAPAEGPVEAQFTARAALQQRGLIWPFGLSNVTASGRGARRCQRGLRAQSGISGSTSLPSSTSDSCQPR